MFKSKVLLYAYVFLGVITSTNIEHKSESPNKKTKKSNFLNLVTVLNC